MQRPSEVQAGRRGAGAGHGAQLGAGWPVERPKGGSAFFAGRAGWGGGARAALFTGAATSTGQQGQALA
jgi:hypothetical protein